MITQPSDAGWLKCEGLRVRDPPTATGPQNRRSRVTFSCVLSLSLVLRWRSVQKLFPKFSAKEEGKLDVVLDHSFFWRGETF